MAAQPELVSGIGQEMLQKMGWQQGDGLGKANQGHTNPLSDGLVVHHDRIGMDGEGVCLVLSLPLLVLSD